MALILQVAQNVIFFVVGFQFLAGVETVKIGLDARGEVGVFTVV